MVAYHQVPDDDDDDDDDDGEQTDHQGPRGTYEAVNEADHKLYQKETTRDSTLRGIPISPPSPTARIVQKG